MRLDGTKSERTNDTPEPGANLYDGKVKTMRYFVTLLLMMSVVGAFCASAPAQTNKLGADYRIVAGDRLLLSVPQRPDLDRQLVVQQNGTVSLPLVGEVEVVGLTAAEAEVRLFQSLKDYYPSLTALNVEIEASGSFEIYVIGEVGAPGKYVFRQPPNLWEAIREAGGAKPTALMDAVRVVQDLHRGGSSRVVDVQRELERGTVDNLPRLEDGDTVVLPQKQAIYTGGDGINVFGAVTRPGIYRLQGEQNVMSAVLQAGGPLPDASLKNVKLVRPKGDGTTETMEINFSRFLEGGDPGSNPQLFPGDTVNIGHRNRFMYALTNETGFILSIVTASATVTLLFIEINRNRNN